MHVCAPVHGWYPLRPEEGVRPGIGVADGYEPPCGCWERNSSLMQEHLAHGAISPAPADVSFDSEIFCQLSLHEEVTIDNPSRRAHDWSAANMVSVFNGLKGTKGFRVLLFETDSCYAVLAGRQVTNLLCRLHLVGSWARSNMPGLALCFYSFSSQFERC